MSQKQKQKQGQRSPPKAYSGKPKASRKVSMPQTYKALMSKNAQLYDSWIQALTDSEKFVAPLGFGTWRNSMVNQLKCVFVPTTNLSGVAYFKIMPTYMVSGALSTPGWYADRTTGTITGGTVSGVGPMPAWNAPAILGDYRLSSISYEIVYLGTELNRGGRAVVLHVPRDIGESDANITFATLASHPQARELRITDQPTILKGYNLPQSKHLCQDWFSTAGDTRNSEVAGWGEVLIMLETAIPETRVEVRIFANYEISPVDVDAGAMLGITNVGNAKFQPECPTLPHVDMIRTRQATAFTSNQHSKIGGILTKVAGAARSVGAWALQHSEAIASLGALAGALVP